MRRNYVATVADLSDEALRCHAYGHAWDRGPVVRLSPVGLQVWSVTLRCTSCGKQRRDYLEPGTYELVEERRYSAPDGYSVIEPAVRADFRGEDIRRANPAE